MKIPVFCSLIPSELLIASGYEPYYLDAHELLEFRAQEYHCVFHENLCSYAKVLYDYFLKRHGEFEMIIIPTSCDALKKLHNALKPVIPAERLYLLDIPKNKDRFAAEFLAVEFQRLMGVLSKSCYSRENVGFQSPPSTWSLCHNRFCHREEAEGRRGDPVTSTAYTGLLRRYASRNDEKLNCDTTSKGRGKFESKSSPFYGNSKIGILGSNVSLDVLKTTLEKFNLEAVYLNHCLLKSAPDEDLVNELKKSLKNYAEAFLSKITCPRMNDYSYKERLKTIIKEEGICGLVVNVLKFCDFHPFDFRFLKKELGAEIPVLLIENELTSNFEGQTMTRLEAFFEKVKGVRNVDGRKRKRNSKNYYVGIDSGSHATKMVCIDREKKVVCREVVSTGTSVAESAETLISRLKEKYSIVPSDVGRVVATGYGRNKIKIADDAMTEITCHALGAHYALGKSATIIDIGGQDSKAIRIDENGGVVRFAMNDKCAAGTGRFLEVMAAKLGMGLEEFAELAYNSSKTVPISSMCSVFAESEVISLIASGKSKEEIAKGIHRSIAERTIALAKRIEGSAPYYMAGGVAKNRGLVAELESCLGEKLTVLSEPQFSGALGAALVALREV